MMNTNLLNSIKTPQAHAALPFDIQSLHDNAILHQQPHSQDYFEIIWILNGSGTCNIDLRQYAIKNNQLFCIRPGQMHQLCLQGNPAGFSICFSKAFINMEEIELDCSCHTNLLLLLSKFNGAVINDEIIIDLNEIIYKMRREIDHFYLYKTEILKRYFKIFLIYLSRQFEEHFQTIAQTRNNELAQSFMWLLDKHFKEKKMVADYAASLCLTPNYLNEIVKKTTGNSAGHHIRQRIALEAKRMALYTGCSMKEIAYELGFLDTAHFSKFFKVVTGTNFSTFKRGKCTLAIAV